MSKRSRRDGRTALFAVILVAVVLCAAYLLWPRKDEETWGPEYTPQENETSENDTTSESDSRTQERRRMVASQIQARHIVDTDVIEAMEAVPRHEFVPADMKQHAYADYPLPIGYGQTISQPYIVAYMTEALELEPGSRALEIGTGSGYQAAVLAEICESVYSVEIVGELADRAESTLGRLGYDNVKVKQGDGYFGWEEHAPYDAVIVTCAATFIPPYLVQQLADGGRLIMPVGNPSSFQTLQLVEKQDGKTTTRRLLDVRFVPMTGKAQDTTP
jgi:protein-L-isoaspartate(D-aspartate) O-methyltransferase